MKKFPQRGEIYWVNLDPTVGSEINKTRPGLIVSNNIGNEISCWVIVAPITSSAKPPYPFEVAIELNETPCKILLDQIRAIDKMRLGDKITLATEKCIEEVEKALKIVLAFL